MTCVSSPLWFLLILFVSILVLSIIIIFLQAKSKTLQNDAENNRKFYSEELIRINNEYYATVDRLKLDYANRLKKIEEDTLKAIEEEKRHSALVIQNMKEFIENRRDILRLAPDKEILINIMLALDGYATRIERLEHGLKEESITEQINGISVTVDKQLSSMLEKLNRKFARFEKKLEENIAETDLITKMSNIQSELASLSKCIPEIERIDDISRIIDNLQDSMDDISGDISTVSNETNTISNMVYSIDDSLTNNYGYDSVRRELNDILDVVNDVKTLIENLNQ